MTLKAIKIFDKLEEEDVDFLLELEGAAKQYKWIPEDELSEVSDLPMQDIEYRLSRLNKFELVERGTKNYAGYRILPPGYDILALKNLVRRDILEGFGRALGIGKEADTFDAITPEKRRVAVKFNRLGLSFRRVKEKRSYSPDFEWFDASKKAAEKEFMGLEKVYPRVEVPEPIGFDRHVLVTGLIEGEELSEVSEIDLPRPVLDEILRNVRETYRVGVVHGDLSEHNIIIKPNGEVLIIDWPQWESLSHPEAEELLRRDVKNVLQYFRRKYRIDRDLETVLEEIKSDS